jgi:hypothetical protein
MGEFLDISALEESSERCVFGWEHTGRCELPHTFGRKVK